MFGARLVIPVSLAAAVALQACSSTPGDPVNTADPALSAQAATGLQLPSRGAGRGILALSDSLGLTDQQVATIRAVLDSLRVENAPLIQQLRPDSARGSRRFRPDPSDPTFQELRQNRKDAMDRIRGVLTDAQAQKLDSLRAERTRRWGRGPGSGGPRRGPGFGGPAGTPVARLQARLGLSQDQVDRIGRIFSDLRSQNQPILEQLRQQGGSAGPGAWRRGGGTDNPLVQQLRENRKTAMQQVQDVLTQEQRDQLQALRPRGRNGAPRDSTG